VDLESGAPSARRNKDDGCQFVEEAVIEARTFHPFVRAASHPAWCCANASHTTKQRAEAKKNARQGRALLSFLRVVY
jgi:hypothetical protein